MKKLQRQQQGSTKTFWSRISYILIGVALLFGGYLIYSSIQAEKLAEQQREVRQQQQDQEKAEEEAMLAEDEENKQEVEYLKCQIEAEKVFIAARDQIPTGYSTSQHIQMLQTLEQKRSTDLDNCDRRNN